MVFSSTVFIFAFLPIVMIGYYILFRIKPVISNYWILAASLIFYAWNKIDFLWILIASIIINYSAAMLIARTIPAASAASSDEVQQGEASKNIKTESKSHKKTGKKAGKKAKTSDMSMSKRSKALIILAVALNLGLLFYFKYFNFTIDILSQVLKTDIDITEVILPIGISFFTFQGLSYVIDVARGDTKVQKNPFKLAMYISMFPQLVAGPIVRYRDIAAEIDSRSLSLEDISDGISRFIFGLFRKVVIADSLAVVANGIFDMKLQYRTVPVAWIGIIAYTLQIYFDFSGYSDMAIGMGRMMGFHFKENFNYPYISDTISEFWRRWHISLSSFFRDYVYIPLGGNRAHVYLNLAIVFLLTGIWHGAAFTFIFWGIWHGIFVIVERLMRRPDEKKVKDGIAFKSLKHIYTMLVVMIGWVFFRAEDMAAAVAYLNSMFGRVDTQSIYKLSWYLTRWNSMVFILAILLSTRLPEKLYLKAKDKLNDNVFLVLRCVILLLLLFECILRIVSGTYSAFIYFQF